MKASRSLFPVLWVVLAPVALCAATLILRPQAWGPRSQSGPRPIAVYAYRQWQSTGIDLAPGDQVRIRASGEWQYSPYVGLHGPEGGGRPVTVDTYPMPRLDGGVLLGRVGEAGEVFYVGRGTTWFAESPGRLYLRINDDLLGDNAGALTVSVDVIPATPTPGR
jgi:hypothetical protein